MSQVRPPHFVNWLLSRLCHPFLWESVEGDLYELFLGDLKKGKSPTKARWKYAIRGLAFLRFHRIISILNSNTQYNMDLFKNYLKVSWRDLMRHKVFASINLTGLVVGFASCLFILQYVLYHTNFDVFHHDTANTYRVINDRFQNGELIQHGTITYPTISPTLHKDFPEVENYTRMTLGGRNYIRQDGELFMFESYLYGDANFFDLFNFKAKTSDQAGMLDEAYELVLTESFAKRMMEDGEEYSDLVGRSVQIFGDNSFKISGVIEDVPTNSHLQFEVMLSYESFVDMTDGGAATSWRWSDFYHYIQLNPDTDLEEFQAKLDDFGIQYFKEGEVSGAVEKFYLQPLLEAHMYSDFEYEIGETVDGNVVWLMFVIAIFILVIAWVNFVNLSTSRATERAKEVGLRKAFGAYKNQMRNQFLVESMIINGIALLVAVGLVIILQGVYQNLIGLPLDIEILLTSKVWHISFPSCISSLTRTFIADHQYLSGYDPFKLQNSGSFKRRTWYSRSWFELKKGPCSIPICCDDHSNCRSSYYLPSNRLHAESRFGYGYGQYPGYLWT